MSLKPIVELGVAEAYALLVNHFKVAGLPPLEATENEDWGRDLLLSRFEDYSEDELAEVGLRVSDDQDDFGSGEDR